MPLRTILESGFNVLSLEQRREGKENDMLNNLKKQKYTKRFISLLCNKILVATYMIFFVSSKILNVKWPLRMWAELENVFDCTCVLVNANISSAS